MMDFLAGIALLVSMLCLATTGGPNSIGRCDLYSLHFHCAVKRCRSHEMPTDPQVVPRTWKKVLVVDNDNHWLTLAAYYLAGYKVIVRTCSDAETALELLSSEWYDFVFLDQRMPKLTGLEILGKSATLQNPKTAFYLLTEYSDPNVILGASRRGVIFMWKEYFEQTLRNMQTLGLIEPKPKPSL